MNELLTQLIAQLQAAHAQALDGVAQFDGMIAAAQSQLDQAAAQRAVYENYIDQIEAALLALGAQVP